jgi:hypothetical protein
VDEEVDAAEHLQQPGQMPAGGALDEMPAAAQILRHGRADLVVELRAQLRWQVDAPQPAGPVALQCLQDDAARDSASDARLDDVPGPAVQHQAANRSCESGVAVAPSDESVGPDVDAAVGQGAHEVGVELPERGRLGTGPGRANEGVQLALPVVVDCVLVRRPRPLPFLDDRLLQLRGDVTGGGRPRAACCPWSPRG